MEMKTEVKSISNGLLLLSCYSSSETSLRRKKGYVTICEGMRSLRLDASSSFLPSLSLTSRERVLVIKTRGPLV